MTPTEEEMKGAVDNLLRTVERTPSSSEPNFEFISIDAGDFQALVDLARLASTTPTRSQGEGEAVVLADEAAQILADVVDEFGGSIAQYHKLGPDYTHKDGTEVFDVSVLLDREALIDRARAFITKQPAQPAEGGDGLLEATIELRTIETVADYLEATGLKPFWVRAVRRLQNLYPTAIAKASRPSTEGGE